MIQKKISKYCMCFLFSLSFLFLLTGCSIAMENEDAAGKKDRLIGAMATRYEIEKTFATYGHKNDDGYYWDLAFEGIEGCIFYYGEWEEDGYTGKVAWGGDVTERNVKTEETDQGIVTKLHADIYFMPENVDEITTLYLNPVYETAEGKIYVMPGDSASMGAGMNVEGTSCSLSFYEEETTTVNHITQLERIEISADFIVKYEPVKIIISQMDENDTLVKKDEYLPDEWKAAGRLETEPETAYLLIETEVLCPDGTTIMQREICDWEGDVIEADGEMEEERFTFVDIYLAEEDGFITKGIQCIIWTEE